MSGESRLVTRQKHSRVTIHHSPLQIEGYASLWGVADLNGDVVQAGAFADSLAKTGAEGVRMLNQHDARAPVGVWEQIVEDARGLFVRGRIEDWSADHDKWEVLAKLNEHNIPCGPILSTKEIIEDESLADNEIVVKVDHPERGEFTTVGMPIKLSDSPAEVKRSPLLGEHNQEIYGEELGLSESDMADLKASGVI